ncbi:MAG: EFR1 family ferrodoxin [Clostridiaceae bacterium]
MRESIAIVYFSGTGNTEAIAGFIRDEMAETYNLDLIKAEDITREKIDFNVEKYHMLGFGYPVHGFNAPALMYDVVKHLPDFGSKRVFLFSTCAGPLYFNDIASFNLKKSLLQKGFDVFYERQFYMPANIGTRYNDEVSKQLCNAAKVKAKTMAGEVGKGMEKIRHDNLGPKMMGCLYTLEKKYWPLVAKDFVVLDSCTKCGKCIEDCPVENISLSEAGITFGERCRCCYRCVYSCPSKAISGKKYKFAIFRDGYDIKKIIENDKLKGEYITPKTWGYYGIFKKYLFTD